MAIKVDKSRLLFLTGDMDDMEIDPGINSPSIGGSPSPVKLEMNMSETLRFKRSSILSPSDDPTPIQDMQSDCFDQEVDTSQDAAQFDGDVQVKIVSEEQHEEAISTQ